MHKVLTIDIKGDILSKVDLRSWYDSESAKKKDIDYDILASSNDEYRLFYGFIETAMADVMATLLKRIKYVSYEISNNVGGTDAIAISMDATYTYNIDRVTNDVLDEAFKILRVAIIDYIVNWVMYQWCLNVASDMAKKYESLVMMYLGKVSKALSYLGGWRRRRSTDLGGI